MKVSIITVTYNSSATILSTLESINEQSYRDIEYIIIDGDSKDDTVDIVKQNCPRVAYIISEPDDGIYDALNKGISIATGDLIGFLHSDDFFAYSDAIKDIVNTLISSNCQAIYADLEYVSKKNINNVVRFWKAGECSRKKLMNGWMPPHPTYYMKRELYYKYGLFDLSLNIAADYDSLLRYLLNTDVQLSYLPKVLIKMRIGGTSNSNLKNIVLKTRQDIIALSKNNVPVLKAILGKNLSKLFQFFR